MHFRMLTVNCLNSKTHYFEYFFIETWSFHVNIIVFFFPSLQSQALLSSFKQHL